MLPTFKDTAITLKYIKLYLTTSKKCKITTCSVFTIYQSTLFSLLNFGWVLCMRENINKTHKICIEKQSDVLSFDSV